MFEFIQQGAVVRSSCNAAARLKFIRSLVVLIGLTAGLASVAFPGAAQAEPSPFATTSATCGQNTEGTTATFPVQNTAHADAIVEFQSDGLSGSIPYVTLGAGDVGAAPYGSVDAGTAPTLGIYCNTPGTVSLSLADRPATPATFNGSTAQGDNSYLSFVAPGEGQYVVDVSISQGSITIGNSNNIIESSGEISLGDLYSGDQNLEVQAQNGPPAVWTATVREVPVAINDLTFGESYIASGAGVAATFSVTGDTTISASIVNSRDAVVRSLGSFPVSEGQSSIPWDGRGEGGAALPDGTYYLVLVSTDPSGDTTRAYAKVGLDNTPPVITMTSPAVIKQGQSVAFGVTDAESGVTSVAIKIGGQEFDYGGDSGVAVPVNGTYVFGTHRASLGTYRWEVRATDSVGNSRTVRGSFRIAQTTSGSTNRRYRLVNCHGGRTNDHYAVTALAPGGCRFGKAAYKSLLQFGLRNARRGGVTVHYGGRSFGLACALLDAGLVVQCTRASKPWVRLYLDSAGAPAGYRWPTHT